MPRRVSLPGASELFRPTDAPQDEAAGVAGPSEEAAAPAKPPARTSARRKAVVPPFEEALPPREEAAGSSRSSTRSAEVDQEPAAPRAAARPRKATAEAKAATGRVRHDEKITVYVSTEELIALESARLRLRGEHGLAADRGRIVRESIAIVMDDLAAHGADSELVRRLGDA